MPITIINPGFGALTPGAQISGSTNLIGPIPLEWTWKFSLVDQTTEEVQLFQQISTQGSRNFAFQWLNPAVGIVQANSPRYMDGAQARLLVELIDTNFVVQESASVAVHYDSTTGLPTILQLQEQGQGGLTQEQAEQLAATTEASALEELTDALTLTELTSGPSSGPIVAPLPTVTFGIIVRLVEIPAGLEPQTPDQQYWVKTLATVRVFRGNDLWMRVPVHTPTKIIPFEKEGLTIWVANLTLTQWLLNIRVLVDFLPGVTGRVYQMHFP
jgi:hypothetical protein